MPRNLTQNELADELRNRPGLIPAALDSLRGELIWTDLNGFHCYEGFFRHSLDIYAAIGGAQPASFRSRLQAVLEPIPDCLHPTGFIFHAGRCGSTLLAKSLSRSRCNLVFAEAGPHKHIWKMLPGCGESELDIYRGLLIAMGRKRLPSYRSHIIKFSSFNIVQYARIRAAFPDVPALFLFRAPGSVVASLHRAKPEFLGQDLGYGLKWEAAELAVEAFFRAALSIVDPYFRCLEYSSLFPLSLPAVLQYFHINPTPSDLRLMTAEFLWDAKSGIVPRSYAQHNTESVGIPERLKALYLELRTHAPLLSD